MLSLIFFMSKHLKNMSTVNCNSAGYDGRPMMVDQCTEQCSCYVGLLLFHFLLPCRLYHIFKLLKNVRYIDHNRREAGQGWEYETMLLL